MNKFINKNENENDINFLTQSKKSSFNMHPDLF